MLLMMRNERMVLLFTFLSRIGNKHDKRLLAGIVLTLCFVMSLHLHNNEDTTKIDRSIVDNNNEFRLRYDWTTLEPISNLAKNISRHQRELCHLPLGYHVHRPIVGMGSNLHVWTQALCVGMERGYRIRTDVPWNAIDQEFCNLHDVSSMTCYFPRSELACPKDQMYTTTTIEKHELDPNNPAPVLFDFSKEHVKVITDWQNGLLRGCSGVLDMYGIVEFRAGAIEYLFSPVSKILQDEAYRQVRHLFGPYGTIPTNLVTVHIRWGDKNDEMTLVQIEKYIQAVQTLVNGRFTSSSNTDTTSTIDLTEHIYVASEDPKAIAAFRNSSPKNWIVYEDMYLQMYESNRTVLGGAYNAHLTIMELFQGRPGLVSLASLLVSMQANEYVLSTGSNWSRLINELRKNVVDPRCNKCTRMIDLGTPDEWR